MPASWSAAAALHFPGGGHQLTTETRGQTAVWTITPERPVWGSQRLVLRSSRALPADRELPFPEITPLGRGAVDACLAVLNGTEGAVLLENPVGLERIEYSSRFQAREFAAASGAPLGAFRVVKEAPSLKVQLPRDGAAAGDSPDGSARVGFADVSVVVMPDGSSLGQGIYEVPDSGSFLSYELPADSTLVWATVDSNPEIPLRSSSGRWSIPLSESRQPHVSLIWRTGANDRRSTGSTWPLVLPRVGQGMTTNLVTLYMPAEYTLGREIGELRPTSMARLEMARADWLLRSVNDFVPRIDRGSNRDHQKLVSMLIGHEMRLRSVSRSDRLTVAAGDASNNRTGATSSWVEAARARRAEAVGRGNLEQDLAIANRYLGASSTSEVQISPTVPEPNAPERIRTLGRPISLMGVLPGVDVPPTKLSLVAESGLWTANANEPASRMIIALVLLMVIGLLTMGWRPGVRTGMLALFLVLGLACLLGGPLEVAVALGLALLGFRKGRLGSFA